MCILKLSKGYLDASFRMQTRDLTIIVSRVFKVKLNQLVKFCVLEQTVSFLLSKSYYNFVTIIILEYCNNLIFFH